MVKDYVEAFSLFASQNNVPRNQVAKIKDKTILRSVCQLQAHNPMLVVGVKNSRVIK